MWLCPGDPRPQKPRIEQSTVKVMLVVFFDAQGVIHKEFIPNGIGIGGRLYAQILDRFRDSLRCRRHQVWQNRHSWALLHDGTLAHRSRPANAVLLRHGIQTLPHPGYSPDLSPADYWFFSRVKSVIKGTRFQDVNALIQAANHVISQIPPAEFRTALDRLQPRLRCCIAERGAYFERE